MQETPRPTNGNALLPWLVALAALLGGILIAIALSRPPPPPDLSAGTTRLEPPRALGEFRLTDHHGQPFTPEHLRGHWTFLFFGYTRCPDVCPTTLTSLNAAARLIAGAEATAAPHYVFVSVDPARDTPEQLARFVPFFNPAFVGVTGEPAALDAFTRQLSVLYLKVETGEQDGYLMDHTASLFLVDPEGRFHALLSPPFEPRVIAQDFQQLIHYYEDTQ